MSIYRSVANIPFGDKVIECVVTKQLQGFLQETDYLGPQSSIRSGKGTKTALTDGSLLGLAEILTEGRMSLLILLYISMASLLECLPDAGNSVVVVSLTGPKK